MVKTHTTHLEVQLTDEKEIASASRALLFTFILTLIRLPSAFGPSTLDILTLRALLRHQLHGKCRSTGPMDGEVPIWIQAWSLSPGPMTEKPKTKRHEFMDRRWSPMDNCTDANDMKKNLVSRISENSSQR